MRTLIERIVSARQDMVGYLKQLGFRRYDFLIPGDQFPQTEDNWSIYSDYTPAAATAINQGVCAYELGKLLEFTDSQARVFAWLAASYKPEPSLQSLLLSLHGTEEGHRRYALHRAVCSGIPTQLSDEEQRYFQQYFSAVAPCCGHTANATIEAVLEHMDIADWADQMMVGLFWLNQRLRKTGGLVDGTIRMKQLEANWANRAPMDAVRECMQISNRCGNILVKLVDDVDSETELTNTINYQLEQRYPEAT